MAINPDDTTNPGAHLGAGPGRVPGRPMLSAATAASTLLAGAAPQRVWALSDTEVADALTTLAQVHASTQALMVSVVAEAKSRGLGSEGGWGPQDWVAMHAPRLSVRTVRDLDTLAAATVEPRLAEVLAAVGAGAAPTATDALEVGRAASLVRFHERIRGLADPDQLAEATTILTESARGEHAMGERDLAVAIRHTADMMRPDRLVEHDADLRRAHRSLTKATGPMGMWRYTMLLDGEGAAILDAAVDALSKPLPDPDPDPDHGADSGGRDLRRPETRRADALLELVTRGVTAADGVGRHTKATLVVTIGLDQLQHRCRGAGITLGRDLLTIDTVRRLACDAQVVPAVLGSHREVLDLGRAERLFNRAQIRHLWLRDQGCSFPHCTRPAQWCDAHHLLHWADGGPTDTDHGALLCQGHHTVVHRNRYGGAVVHGPSGPRVRWDLTPGSYDTHLAHWRRTNPPPPR